MVYNYTKPRSQIAAQYSSPGPCYGLPGLVGQRTHDPRSVHRKGAAYPFGVRHGKFRDDCSPGPMYYPDTKVYRDGKDGTPHYSLYGRQRDGSLFNTPGPGAYSPEKVGQQGYSRQPAFSFGTRHRHKQNDNTPAPNNYSLPHMLGHTCQSGKVQAACYSLSGRQKQGSFSEDLSKTPGPGTYQTIDPGTYKNRAPLYSMTSRNIMPGDSTQKPGPGAHSPEKVWGHKQKRPEFSFGIRHSQYLAPLVIEVQE